MNNAKEITAIASEVYEITGYNSEKSAGEGIGHALVQLKRAYELDPDLSSNYDLLCDIDGMLNDFNRELSCYMEEMEFDRESFDATEKRLDLIRGLEAKYGNTIEDVLNTLQECKEQRDKLADYDVYIENLEKTVKDLEKQVIELSDKLTKVRKKYAKELCDVIIAALKELNFLGVKFDMEFNKLDNYTSNGNDEAHFMISTNVGERMKTI